MRLQKASVRPSGTLIGPRTSRSLPVQSMTIPSSPTVTVTFNVIIRSRSTPSLSTKSLAVQVPLGSFRRASRASRSPWSLIASIAPISPSAPYLSAISRVRRTPVTHAETCAWMSPTVRSGRRLLNRMMLKTSALGTPRRYSFVAGKNRPSWYMSVESRTYPGSFCFRSSTWIRQDVNPMRRSPWWTGAKTRGSSVCADAQYG
ncbi:hypothetical protein L0F81_07800 [Streptomyces tricolor]|uniref:Uncharacterized protein n=1 Tax=Streptomyces tricolor TaxID=68277 RepID=A0ABS9JC99_9ACTN|nr:hypothetical protein [Streptomyces tricolor]MCG0063193.1 hypothetical protein [Streptomyces tricolor]